MIADNTKQANARPMKCIAKIIAVFSKYRASGCQHNYGMFLKVAVERELANQNPDKCRCSVCHGISRSCKHVVYDESEMSKLMCARCRGETDD